MSFVKPAGNGVRILSLDGGDSRCLSQLLVLQELMHRLEHDHGRRVRPCDYFHSITGVGASGLIAILLGVLGMTVENAMKAFTAICEKVFPPDGCDEASRSERLTQEVERVLDELDLTHGTRMEGDLDLSAGSHVSICYSSASIIRCRMFRNYKSRQFSYNPTIIEAVRAAWATPGLFSSTRIGPPSNQEELVSAVNGFNNPALEAVKEARDIFGGDRMISTLLSLGSGARAPISTTSDRFLEKSVQQTENVEEGIERLLGTSDVYFRFSPQHTVQSEILAHEKQIEAITSYTHAYIERERISRSMDDFLGESAHTSNINLELKDTARLKNTTADAEPVASNAPVSNPHSLYNDELLLAELRIPGLQCGPPLAGCMDGTREGILQKIIAWTADFAAPNILWLKGYPGVGKSAIAAKIVEEIGALRCLGSSFFFQRQNAAALTPQALWRTVAYDLARRHPPIRKIMVSKLQEAGVGATAVNVESLFRHVIHEPLIGCEDIQNAKLPVIVVDALDECGGLDGHHSQHRKALMKTLENWSRLPGKFKLVVTSRGENDIERLFSKILHLPIEILAGQTVDMQSSEDIQVFLKTQLHDVAIQYPRSLSPDWPGIRTVKVLAERAAGLFIWAETVVKFIALGDPPRRLDQVLRGGGIGDLGVLYGEVLSTSFRGLSEEDLGDFRSVIGGIILAKAPLSFSPLAQLLSIEDHTVEHICNSLQSVLDSKEVLLFHHQSFVDFLLDEKKCPPRYLIDPTSERQKLALACFRTMDTSLRFNICGLNSSHLRNVDIPDLPSRERESIPAQLSYSCVWWASHLVETEFDAEIMDRVQYFMSTHFLWWLEVLSISKQVNRASEMLSQLIDWIPARDHKNAMEMVRDMQKFVAAFAGVISQSVPHIYLSALPFSPRNSAVSNQYAHIYPKTLATQIGGLSNWPAIQNVLTGHKKSVSSVAFSPDGKRIVSGSYDNTIRVWGTETGEVVAGPFYGHNESVNSVAFSPDGNRIVSGSSDRTIRVWDAGTGELIVGSFEGHGKSVNSVAFSPDGKRIVSGSYDKTIRVWDAENMEAVAGPFEGHSDCVTSVTFSPDGRRIASGSSDKTIRIWDAGTSEVIAGPFEGHGKWVSSVAFSPEGKRIVSGSYDKTIRVWDADTGEVVAGPFKGHRHLVNSVAFSPDGKQIVSASYDKTIRVWDAGTMEVVAGPFEGHSDCVISVAFSPEGKRIVSGSSDKTIRVWDAGTGEAISGTFEGHGKWVNSVAFSPDGKRIVSGSNDQTIRIWGAKAGEVVSSPFKGHSNWVNSVAFSPDGKRIVSGSWDKEIRIWDAQAGGMVAGPFRGHSDCVNAVAFSPDGKRVVSGSSDQTIRVWDAQTGKAVAGPFKGCSDRVHSVAFSPDGKRIVSGSYDNTIRVWDAETGEAVSGPFEEHSHSVNSVIFSPDGKRIASGSTDQTIRVWDADTGGVVAGPFKGHSSSVDSVAFSPDGERIVSGSYDETIRVWDASTGEVVAGPFKGHSDWVNSVAFSPDGTRIVSGSRDSTIRVWDAALRNSGGIRPIFPPFSDESEMEDGWVLGAHSELLFWVPPALRVGLWRPGNSVVIGQLITTRLDLSAFVHGDSWHLCKNT